MDRTLIGQQAENTFDGLHEGEKVRETLMPLWRDFEAYLGAREALPERLEEIPEASLAPFVQYCEDNGMDDERLLLTLSAVRMILVRAGWKPARLAALVAPRRRVRIRNSETGRYRFVLVPKDR